MIYKSGGIVRWSAEKILIVVHPLCGAVNVLCQTLTTKMQKDSTVHVNCTGI